MLELLLEVQETMNHREELIYKMTDFLRFIGLEVNFDSINEETVLPGLKIRAGTLVVDMDRLLYPGDILHEAGHLATLPAVVRSSMNDRLEANDLHQSGEIMAFAWSYAASLHLNIDPHIVFHGNGYQGNGAHVVNEFRLGHFIGIPLMEWYGLCYTPERAAQLGKSPFPQMKKWVCEAAPVY